MTDSSVSKGTCSSRSRNERDQLSRETVEQRERRVQARSPKKAKRNYG